MPGCVRARLVVPLPVGVIVQVVCKERYLLLKEVKNCLIGFVEFYQRMDEESILHRTNDKNSRIDNLRKIEEWGNIWLDPEADQGIDIAFDPMCEDEDEDDDDDEDDEDNRLQLIASIRFRQQSSNDNVRVRDVAVHLFYRRVTRSGTVLERPAIYTRMYYAKDKVPEEDGDENALPGESNEGIDESVRPRLRNGRTVLGANGMIETAPQAQESGSRNTSPTSPPYSPVSYPSAPQPKRVTFLIPPVRVDI